MRTTKFFCSFELLFSSLAASSLFARAWPKAEKTILIVGIVVCISIIYEWANEGRNGGGRAESRMNLTNLIDSKLVFQINYANIVRSSSMGHDREGMEEERGWAKVDEISFWFQLMQRTRESFQLVQLLFGMKQEEIEVMNEWIERVFCIPNRCLPKEVILLCIRKKERYASWIVNMSLSFPNLWSIRNMIRAHPVNYRSLWRGKNIFHNHFLSILRFVCHSHVFDLTPQHAYMCGDRWMFVRRWKMEKYVLFVLCAAAAALFSPLTIRLINFQYNFFSA